VNAAENYVIYFYNVGEPLGDGEAGQKHVRQSNV
jgi:hypothetical protein